jgi:hypothetical protein
VKRSRWRATELRRPAIVQRVTSLPSAADGQPARRSPRQKLHCGGAGGDQEPGAPARPCAAKAGASSGAVLHKITATGRLATRHQPVARSLAYPTRARTAQGHEIVKTQPPAGLGDGLDNDLLQGGGVKGRW